MYTSNSNQNGEHTAPHTAKQQSTVQRSAHTYIAFRWDSEWYVYNKIKYNTTGPYEISTNKRMYRKQCTSLHTVLPLRFVVFALVIELHGEHHNQQCLQRKQHQMNNFAARFIDLACFHCAREATEQVHTCSTIEAKRMTCDKEGIIWAE